jgi:hypothetical protein
MTLTPLHNPDNKTGQRVGIMIQVVHTYIHTYIHTLTHGHIVKESIGHKFNTSTIM